MSDSGRPDVVRAVAGAGLCVVCASFLLWDRPAAWTGRNEDRVARRDRHPRDGATTNGFLVRRLRLADELAGAVYEGPNPKTVYGHLRFSWKSSLDPYGRIPSYLRYLRVKVPLARGDLVGVLRAKRRVQVVPMRSGMQQWRARYEFSETKTALVCSPGKMGRTSLSYRVFIPPGGLLEFGVGAVPGRVRAGSVTMAISLVDPSGQSHPLWSRELREGSMLQWFSDKVSLQAWAGRRVLLVLSCRGQGAVGLWADPEIWSPGRPLGGNVLLLVVDSLRPDALGAFGGRESVSPNLDRLARQGTSFTRFFSNGSWARASLGALFSANLASAVGLVPGRLLMRAHEREAFHARQVPEFPDHMVHLGYRVAAFVEDGARPGWKRVGVDWGFPDTGEIRHLRSGNHLVTAWAIRFLKENRDRPFFLFLRYVLGRGHVTGSHKPLPTGGDEKLGDSHWEAYLSQVRRVDGEVGRLVAALDALGLSERTLVVVTAEHGEVFSKAHDRWLLAYRRSTLHRHSESVWDEVSHIPLVLRQPGSIPEGRKIVAQLAAVDLSPTLLDLLGLTPMGPVFGRSFAPLVSRGLHGVDRPVLTEGLDIEGLRMDGWKYVRRGALSRRFLEGGKPVSRSEELFDLRVDPRETRNLALERPKRLAELRQEMDRLLRQAHRLADEAGRSQKARILFLRLCSMTKKLIQVDLQGGAEPPVVRQISGRARVRVRRTPLGTDGLRVFLAAGGPRGRTCSLVAVRFDTPIQVQVRKAEVGLLAPRVRVGPYGLPLLHSWTLRPWDERLWSPTPPAPADGLSLWTSSQEMSVGWTQLRPGLGGRFWGSSETSFAGLERGAGVSRAGRRPRWFGDTRGEFSSEDGN